MTILDFDEIEKYQEVRTWILSQTPSQLMENKKRAVDVVWDLLTYLYMLGFTQATEEVGQEIAEGAKPFLPKDYDDLSDSQKKEADKAIYKQFDNQDFQDRVRKYAEMGNAQDILRVAETDGNRVYNVGGLNAVKGKAKTKTWNTMMDDRVRDTHDFLEGITIPVEDKFVTYDGDEADAPCGFNNVENNARCRCWLTFGN